jgi:hypothetical protein
MSFNLYSTFNRVLPDACEDYQRFLLNLIEFIELFAYYMVYRSRQPLVAGGDMTSKYKDSELYGGKT